MKRTGALLFAAWVAAGCAALPKSMTAPAAEYELYRKTRVAATLEDRLAAGWQYLSAYPDGVYREEIQDWFGRVEPAYYMSARDSRKRLSRYLEALPKGPHAQRASQRILELERGRRGERERDARVLADARRVQDQVRAAAEARSEFVSTIAAWVRRLAAIDTWGGRTSDLDHEFIHAYRVVEPQAVCDNSACEKQLSFSYQVPRAGQLVPRVATVTIRLELSEGGVTQARLQGPLLFSRIGEASQRSIVDAYDLQARAEGIGQSVRMIASALEARLPEASCRAEVVSPVVLERRCNGVRATMIAAEDVDGEDAVVIEALREQANGPPEDVGSER